MEYSNEILKKVWHFGVLQYNVADVVSAINPDNPTQFEEDLEFEESVLCIMYKSGLGNENNGEGVDAALKKIELKREQRLQDLINDFCGYDD